MVHTSIHILLILRIILDQKIKIKIEMYAPLISCRFYSLFIVGINLCTYMFILQIRMCLANMHIAQCILLSDDEQLHSICSMKNKILDNRKGHCGLFGTAVRLTYSSQNILPRRHISISIYTKFAHKFSREHYSEGADVKVF